MSETIENWGLTEEDLGLIVLVRDEIIAWRGLCQTAEHFLALGAVIAGLDNLLSDLSPKSAARVSLDYLVGEESRSASIMLDQDELELGQSAYFYDPSIGGDGESRIDAVFSDGNAPSGSDVFSWIDASVALRSLANSLEVELFDLPEI